VHRRDIPDVVDAYSKERGGGDKVINDLGETKATKRVHAGTRGIARVNHKKRKEFESL
jgi:hypothetical protein